MISDRLKFLRNTSLKKLGLYLIASIVLIFIFEFILIDNRVKVLEQAEETKDYVRGAQLEAQQAAYMVQAGELNENSRAEIYARINGLDHNLLIIRDGGRVDRTDVFLQPLSRLPRITFEELYKSWNIYRNNINATVFQEQPQATAVTQNDSTAIDSIQTATSLPPSEPGNVALLPGQWLTLSNWFEKVNTDLIEEVQVKKASVERWFILFATFDLLLFCGLFIVFYRYVIKPLREVKSNASARLHESDLIGNEIGEISSEINEILLQLKMATDFVAAIGEGKLNFDYKSLDSNYTEGKNRLADSLIQMQNKLRALNDEEQKRQWANEGLTRFVDILRSSNDNLATLGDKIIAALVKYTNSNQGGLYVLNDDDEQNKHLELLSLFAFDIKKYDKQRLKLGEGILGQTFLEKETTVINHIPDEYVKITSGLGGATPRSLLIVPLKVDKDVYGIVELASFKVFEQHEISFVEKIAETIASTLASVKVAQKSKHLIEQFQQQTEEMRAQEEEMRQNMEELQATQEELARKEQDYIIKISDLESQSTASVSRADFERTRVEYEKRISDQLQKIRELEGKLATSPQKVDDWELAQDVEKALRIQMEALQITQEELQKKTRQ